MSPRTTSVGNSRGDLAIRALVVGRREGRRRELSRWLSACGYRVVETGESPSPSRSDRAGKSARHQIVFYAADVLDVAELRGLRETSLRERPTPVVVVASSRDPHVVVEAVKSGASDFVQWPTAGEEAEVALCRVLSRFLESDASDWCVGCDARTNCTMERLRAKDGPVVADLVTEPYTDDALRERDYPFLMGSPAMREIDRVARQLADSDVTVLIRGASGTGKEVVARHLHRRSLRRSARFVKVNCAAVPESLLENELFGHERGAFTGADTRTIGKFEEANGGTILLDEIGEMSSGLQAKLLQVLQDKEFSRLGGIGSVAVDTRIIASTNRNLEEEVEAGRFREDLYFRLKVIDLYLPPLKDRREEIPLLLDYFRCRFASEYRRPAPEFDEHLLGMLLSYDWPGNVRELENLVTRAVVLGEESVLNELTEKRMQMRQQGDDGTPAAGDRPIAMALKDAASRAALTAERELILSALQRTHWNRKEAARLLGVSYRTIRSKIKRYELETS